MVIQRCGLIFSSWLLAPCAFAAAGDEFHAFRLNGPLPRDVVGDVFDATLSPNGQWIVYSAVQSLADGLEVYSVPADGSQAPVRLSNHSTSVSSFRITPDGARVVYQSTNLYSVPIGGGQVPVKLNGTLPGGGAITSYVLAPDSSRVVYRGDAHADNAFELFSAPIGASGGQVTLNDPLLGGAILDDGYAITPDSSRVVFLAPQPTRLFVVDDTPSSCRTSADIQSAVNAASEGDVILVKSGLYSGFPSSFVIDGKSLCVIGEGGPQASFDVKNLRADQRVIVRGIQHLQGHFAPRLTNNSGPIWLEDCSWESSSVQATSSFSTVGLFRCRVSGGLLDTNGAFNSENSLLFAYHSSFQGREGSAAYFDDSFCEMSGGLECTWSESSDGELGLRMTSSGSAFLFGCSLSGGRGGEGAYSSCCNDELPASCGGNALALYDSTRATVLQTQLTGGFPDCDHAAVSGPGTLTTLQGMTGEFSVDFPVPAGAPLHYRFKGPPGWKAFITYSSTYTPILDPMFHGMSVVPLGSPTVFVGTLPASGELETVVSHGNLLEPGAEARVIHLQAKFYDPTRCWGVLGTPSALVVVRDACP